MYGSAPCRAISSIKAERKIKTRKIRIKIRKIRINIRKIKIRKERITKIRIKIR